MASLLGGAALGAAFEVLFGEVKIAVKKAVKFKSKLKKINEKLERLDNPIKEIQRSNTVLDLPQLSIQKFLEVMEAGNELVRKCSSVGKWWNFYKWSCYTTKLIELDESLRELMDILQVQLGPVHLETLELVRHMHAESMRNQEKSLQENKINVKGGFEVPEPPEFTVGLEVPLQELKMKLLREDSSVLVLTAPPGCGKTTLVKKLCWEDDIKAKFNNIMFVKVSKTADLKLIVQHLYEHNGRAGPFLRDEEDAAICLKRLLKEIGQISSILLVLDDVWSGSESLIMKFRLQIPEYKILVTSRSEFSGLGSPYKLETLSDDDATTLFRHYAISEDESSNIEDGVVKKVVQHCKKVPLALVLVGALLRGRPQEIWERKVEEWSEDSSVLTFEDELLACLKSSLDFMGEKDAKLKECFLDLASFPEDKRIPATALIDMWTELHGLKESHAAANLFELNHWNMADVVVTRTDAYEKDGYYSEHFVTQHDMLRELAIHECRKNPEEQRKRLILELNGNNLPAWWNEPNEATFNAKLVSITTDGKFSSKWCNIKLPAAEVLILNFQTENYVLPNFLKTMNKLKVLIITNHGFLPARLSNFELLGSLTNLRRIRFERIVIPSLSETSIKLKNLQKFSLFLCKVAQAFGSIRISQMFPSLEELNIDYCTDFWELPIGFFDMVNEKLRKLSITHCHKLSELPEEIENLSNLELLRLRSCIGLENLPDSICKLHRLAFLDISDCFSIWGLPEHIGEMHGLTKINMKDCSRLQELPPTVLDLEELKEVVCDEDIKELWEMLFFDEAEVNVRSEDDKKINLRLAKEDPNLKWL